MYNRNTPLIHPSIGHILHHKSSTTSATSRSRIGCTIHSSVTASRDRVGRIVSLAVSKVATGCDGDCWHCCRDIEQSWVPKFVHFGATEKYSNFIDQWKLSFADYTHLPGQLIFQEKTNYIHQQSSHLPDVYNICAKDSCNKEEEDVRNGRD